VGVLEMVLLLLLVLVLRLGGGLTGRQRIRDAQGQVTVNFHWTEEIHSIQRWLRRKKLLKQDILSLRIGPI
jgi:hypothetical protein